jgi:hypothetical protein
MTSALKIRPSVPLPARTFRIIDRFCGFESLPCVDNAWAERDEIGDGDGAARTLVPSIVLLSTVPEQNESYRI